MNAHSALILENREEKKMLARNNNNNRSRVSYTRVHRSTKSFVFGKKAKAQPMWVRAFSMWTNYVSFSVLLAESFFEMALICRREKNRTSSIRPPVSNVSNETSSWTTNRNDEMPIYAFHFIIIFKFNEAIFVSLFFFYVVGDVVKETVNKCT